MERLSMGLRILHAVEFYAPSVGGAQEVVRQISERLAARGHDVTVATSRLSARREEVIAGVRVAEFDVHGNEVRRIEGDVGRYRTFVAEGGFDVVMTYAAQQWTTDALLPALDAIAAPVVLAPCGFSGLRRPEYAGYFATLPERLAQFDALVFHSESYQDIAFARDAGLARLEVIPNGADEREFGDLESRGAFREAVGAPAQAPLLLTVGGHTGLKGHAQAMAAFRRSRRARGGRLAIVGNTPTGPGCLMTCRARAAAGRLARPDRRVLLTDPPRDLVLQAYADADLFVFASMVECSPLVLFEAMAAGLAFVTVDVGNAAEIAGWSGAGLVVPSRRRPDGLVEADPDDLAAAVDELLGDDHRRTELGRNGRRAWRESFTWDHLASRYESLYDSLVGSLAR
jgi:glycosyltransferase involved in cell wall biosynthesis